MDLETAWKDKNFEVIWTEDGSPSLKPLFGSEMMHHRGGAFAETQYIYGDVIRQALTHGGRHFLSVGLGLAYNEFVIADEALEMGLTNVHIHSFETEDALKVEILDYILAGKVTRPSQEVYGPIVRRLKNGERVLDYLKGLAETGKWQLEGALSLQSSFERSYQAILFDAYSTKTSPELWTENFLSHFLAQVSDRNFCLFTTYACTGVLKKALKLAEFQVKERQGFHGKRSSTLAILSNP